MREQGRERKAFLRQLFQQTMQAVTLGPALYEQVSVQNGELVFGPERFSLAKFRRILVVAIGKAATPMADHLHAVLAPVEGASLMIEGVVVGTAPWTPYPGWRFFAGSHPLPTDSSFDAAELLLKNMAEVDEQTLVLFLISGGASSMLDASCDSSISRE
jgi:glycerate 2-kinase